MTNELFLWKKFVADESLASVRYVWQRHDLENMNKRLKANKEAHGAFESERPGYCGAQDTF